MAANLYYGSEVGAHPIYLARLPGGPLPVPPGEFQFVYPKILAAPNGDVHLVWAEFDSTRHDAGNWSGARKTTLWHAAFARGTWSVPRKVFEGDWLEWPTSAGNVAIDSAGTVHVVLLSWGGAATGIVHLTATAAGWQTHRTPYNSFQAAVHPLGNSLLVAFAGNSDGPSDTTGVTVAISPDRGVSWTSSIVVDRLRGRLVSDLQFVHHGEDVYLAWAESPPRQWRDTLRIMRLGRPIRPAPVAAVPLPSGTSTVTVAHACGNFVFVAETFSQLPTTFFGTVTENGKASRPVSIAPGQITTSSGLGTTSTSAVVMVVIKPKLGVPARSVLMSRSACTTPETP